MVDSAKASEAVPVRICLISLDGHLAGAVERAEARLRRSVPGARISFHAASDWARSPQRLENCRADIAKADFIIASMLFMEDHIQAVLPALQTRSESCDAIAGCLSAAEVVKTTRLGRFRMDKPESGPIALLKRLRGSSDKSKAGASQMRMLRRLPKLLKYVPGAAQDVRAYFLTLQYWLAGSEENIADLCAYLINRYADGPRAGLRGALNPAPPVEYPEIGVYHPRMTPAIGSSVARLPYSRGKRPVVGLLLLRSYLLSGDTGHYDGVIERMEAQGLRVIPAFASGLDARPAIDAYFMKDGQPTIDALVSLTGFSLVGGPAYNDAGAAAKTLEALDVPYLSAQALEFQSLEEWRRDDRGLTPIEATMMVAIPEIDGATGPIVFGGRAGAHCDGCERQCDFTGAETAGALVMRACAERADMLARRTAKLIALRQKPASERKIAVSLFNFPPNGGGVGTAAGLAVYESLFNTLKGLSAAGYEVDLPADANALRERLLVGNAEFYGTDANVHARLPADDHVRREQRLAEIEAQWGPAPGRQLTDGRSIQILGERFGNVFVGVQPAFGYEGDPMRLLFEKGFAPTHAFAAYCRYLREDFAADAILHFGTHGALEFMPGKQAGLSADCWSDYLIGDLPNIYFYAANNPSEAAIAKRRSAATVVSYLSPSVTEAGLYRDLADLKDMITRWRGEDSAEARQDLAEFIHAQAVALDLAELEPAWPGDAETEIEALRRALDEVERSVIPHGLHIAGEAPDPAERIDLMRAMADADGVPHASVDALTAGVSVKTAAAETGGDPAALQKLERAHALLLDDHEIPALMRALDGRFIEPVAGGDLVRTPEILPTGRNIHGFDPFRLPSRFALEDGRRQAAKLLERHLGDGGATPETVAIVLWGTDNLKSEGAQISQALALMGAAPRFDSYGRLAGADLVPLESLGRPRIDVIATLSGIFRDLLPLQTRMLAEAAFKAAQADEPAEANFIRKHALAYQTAHGCDMETAALRVFSNADGAYGSNVNMLVDSSCWEDEDELGDAFAKRKCYAYGLSGGPTPQAELLNSVLKDVDLAYQNLESVELGLTTIDHYFDTLGGIGRAVKKAKGADAPVYIGDHTHGDGAVRTLSEQVSLEARTRTLNPKWYEAMLKHGYEGVRQIEAHVTNTMGWSATTGQVEPWVYQRIGETFVLDEALRDRLAALNPKSCAKVANRLLEACDRHYWTPDPETLEALRRAGEDLEDLVEGVGSSSEEAAA
ncbi:MAG: magnesium chelatase subunit H [Pseudomonadota bacterium]